MIASATNWWPMNYLESLLRLREAVVVAAQALGSSGLITRPEGAPLLAALADLEALEGKKPVRSKYLKPDRAPHAARTEAFARVRIEIERVKLLPVATAIAERHMVRLDDLLSPDRKTRVCRARRELWVVMREAGFMMAEIGDMFGRDHSSISQGVSKGRREAQALPKGSNERARVRAE